jgi:subtilase family serine protease
VVSVGATLTPVSTSGQLTGPITAWGLQTNAGSGGSGGGTSVFFAQPAFQRGAKNVAGATRNTPDIALEGDDYTGVAVLEYGGTSDQYIFPDGGTSVATPEAAAMWSLVLQACKQNTTCVSRGSGSHPYRLGNPNPLFYEDIYADAGTYAGAFYDVVFGSNSQLSYCDKPGSKDCPKPGTTPTPVPTLVPGGYQAGPGYDRVTGLGAPFGAELIQTVLSEVTK